MSDIILFLFSVVVISLSGVLMPGPVSAVTVAKGAEDSLAGVFVSLGHGVVEFPLIALIYFGLASIFKLLLVKVMIGFLGGGVLIWMGITMLFGYKSQALSKDEGSLSPFQAGVILTISNPYFLVWWATAGANIILTAIQFGIFVIVLASIVHWLCDLVWYGFLSYLSFVGGKFFGRKLQQALFIICGLALIYFGLFFISRSALAIFENYI